MKKLAILLACAIFFIFHAEKLKSQENKVLKFEIKLNKDQIENIEKIKLAYSQDICPGCPEDSCIYCPIFSINKEGLQKNIRLEALVKNAQNGYTIIITDKDGKQIKIKDPALDIKAEKNIINLKKLEINEIQ